MVLLAHQPGFLHIAEFYRRAALVADMIADSSTTALRNAGEDLGDEAVTVVCDSIANLAEHITLDDGELKFRRRKIVLLSNPNLFPEFARRNAIQRLGNWYALDTSFCHEGQCAWLVHDKGVQQDVCEGTGFTSLKWREANTQAECIEIINRFHSERIVAVGK